MAETITKPKLQLRSGASFNVGDGKTPSPATKLLLNHGKPNFTIQKNGNGSASPQSPTNNNNNNYNRFANANSNGNAKDEFIVKSTKFNGVFKPANVPVNGSDKQPHQQTAADNEAAKVVLRRIRVPEPAPKQIDEDENVPEFIRRQRRIQERLAKENVLDFEHRRSGYFTHCIVSPTSPANRTSFIETMSSPAIVPSLEMPAPAAQPKKETTIIEEQQQPTTNGHILSNGHDEEEEVNQAIEEVNKAVAGEADDTNADVEEQHATSAAEQTKQDIKAEESAVIEVKQEQSEAAAAVEPIAAAAAAVEPIAAAATVAPVEPTAAAAETAEIVHAAATEHLQAAAAEEQQQQHAAKEVVVEEVTQNGHAEQAKEKEHAVEVPLQNGHATEAQQQNGHHDVVAEITQNGHANTPVDNVQVTISHTNGIDATAGPCIPAADPSGEKGVNFEPKTVVSFSKDLGSEPNKYPDTVQVTKDPESPNVVDENLQELSKLKFEIIAGDQDVQVTPVIKAD